MRLTQKNGLLPDLVSDLLPREAFIFNSIRDQALSCARLSGYELVCPPMLEYLDSFLKKDCDDLQNISLKVTELFGNQTLAVRADITPQIARIDTHVLQTNGVTRFCYAGDVFRAKSSFDGLDVFQIGAEVFGSTDLSADIEIAELANETLSDIMNSFGLSGRWTLDITHSGFLVSLLEILEPELRQKVVLALKTKDFVTLSFLLKHGNSILLDTLNNMMASESLDALKTNLNHTLPLLSPKYLLLWQNFITQLESFVTEIVRLDLNIELDLLGVSGFDYHSGITWSLWLSDSSVPIARGGRYDGIGSVFGRSRPATGFSFDAKRLAKYVAEKTNVGRKRAILAPSNADEALRVYIKQLRREGHVVVRHFTDAEPESTLYVFDQHIALRDGRWAVFDRDM